MTKSLRNVVVAIGMMICLPNVSLAYMTTWTFAGTVTPGSTDAVGETITGYLTLDPLAANGSLDTDGSTYQIGSRVIYPPYAQPQQLSGSAKIGSNTFMLGGGGKFDLIAAMVLKNNIDAFSSFNVSGQSQWRDGAGGSTIIALSILDQLGALSEIFPDVSAGVALDQNVNWVAHGANATMRLIYENKFYSARLTSVEVATESPYGVPEPGSLALFCAGVIGIVSSRRRNVCLLFLSRCK